MDADGGEELRGELRGSLAIGTHYDVEVTDVREGKRRMVSQAFCSGLPAQLWSSPRAGKRNTLRLARGS